MKHSSITNEKIALVLLVSLLILTLFASVVYAQSISAALATIKDKVVELACTIYLIIQAVVGVLAVLMMILAGLKWMTSDDPDSRSESKNRILYIIVGVLVVLLALPAVNLFARTLGIIAAGDPDIDCGAIAAPTTISGPIRNVICIVVRILQAVAGIIAMIVLTLAGLKWIAAESPEDRAGAKKLALNVIIGVLVIIIGGQALSVLFYGVDAASFTCPAVASYTGLQALITTITYTVCIILRTIQFTSGFVAAIAIMFAGLKWLSSDNPEDRSVAKKMVLGAILGFLTVLIAAQALATLFGPGLGFTCGAAEIPDGIEDIIEPTICVILTTVKAVAGIIAAIIVAFAGVKWMSSDDAEERGKAKKWIMNAIVGFLVVILGAQALGTLFGNFDFTSFTCAAGDELPYVTDTFCVILRTIQAVAAIIAAVVIGLAGMKWMAFDIDFEERNKAKGLAIHAIIGLLIVIIGVQFMGSLFTEASFTSFTCGEGSALSFVEQPLCVMLNILMAVAAVIAAITFLFAAFKWFIAGGDPESRARAKGAVFNVIVGFLIVVISVQFVNVVVNGNGLTQVGCSGEGSDIAAAFVAPMCIILRAVQLFGVLIAMVVMLIAGMRWIALEDPEQRRAAKAYLFYSLLSLIIVLLVVQFINAMLTGAASLTLSPTSITCPATMDPGIQDTIRYTGCMVFNTMKLVAIILAVIATLYVGIKLMSTDDPEERSTAKMMIFNIMVGLTIVLMTTSFLGPIISESGEAPGILSFTCEDNIPSEVETTVEYVGCLFYWILLVMAIALAILVISLAGLRWMFSDDVESRQSAKNIILYAIIGTLVAILAWQIVGSVLGEGTFRDPFTCSSFTNNEVKVQIQYTACLFIYLIWYSVAGLATILIAIAGLIWMFAEDPERRTWAKWMIGHIIIGALIIMAAAFFINALVSYEAVSVSGEYFQGISCACKNDIFLLDDEIIVTVSVTNPGDSPDTFTACVLNSAGAVEECESKDIDAGATESIKISSDVDMTWSLKSLGGSFSVTVSSTGGTETYGPVLVPSSVGSDRDCCDQSSATTASGGPVPPVAADQVQAVITSVSHSIAGDEIDISVTIENTGSVNGSFKAYVFDVYGNEREDEPDVGGEDIAANETGFITLSSSLDPAWDVCDLMGSYTVKITDESTGNVLDNESVTFTPPEGCPAGPAQAIITTVSHSIVDDDEIDIIVTILNNGPDDGSFKAYVLDVYGNEREDEPDVGGMNILMGQTGSITLSSKNDFAWDVCDLVDDGIVKYTVKITDESTGIPLGETSKTLEPPGVCAAGQVQAVITSVSHSIDDDEIDIIVTIENTGPGDGSFKAYVLDFYNTVMEDEPDVGGRNIAAGETGSITLSSKNDPTWNVCDLVDDDIVKYNVEIRDESTDEFLDETSKSHELPGACATGPVQALITAITHSVAGDEIDITVDIANYGSVDGSFKAYVFDIDNKEMEDEPDVGGKHIAAGETGSITLSSNLDPTWNVCDLVDNDIVKYTVEIRDESTDEFLDKNSDILIPPEACTTD